MGHTDESGKSPISKTLLFIRRAKATKQYLIDEGVRPNQLIDKGFSSDP